MRSATILADRTCQWDLVIVPPNEALRMALSSHLRPPLSNVADAS